MTIHLNLIPSLYPQRDFHDSFLYSIDCSNKRGDDNTAKRSYGLGNKISRVLSVFLSLHHGAPVKKLSLSALVLPRRQINSPIMVLLQVFFSPNAFVSI